MISRRWNHKNFKRIAKRKLTKIMRARTVAHTHSRYNTSSSRQNLKIRCLLLSCWCVCVWGMRNVHLFTYCWKYIWACCMHFTLSLSPAQNTLIVPFAMHLPFSTTRSLVSVLCRFAKHKNQILNYEHRLLRFDGVYVCLHDRLPHLFTRNNIVYTRALSLI